MRLEFFSPLEKRKLDDKGAFDDRCTKLGNQFCGRCSSAAGGYQIVGDDHPGVVWNGIDMNLERVRAIFQLITGAMSLVRKLSRLAHHAKTSAELVGQCRSDNETTGFDAQNRIYFLGSISVREYVDRSSKKLAVSQ